MGYPTKMDACQAVEREIDKVLSKFVDIDRQTADNLTDLLKLIDNVRQDLAEDSESDELTTAQSLILTQCIRKAKETFANLSSSHRDLHGSVSKVGKSVDRNFVSDFSSVISEGAFHGIIQ